MQIQPDLCSEEMLWSGLLIYSQGSTGKAKKIVCMVGAGISVNAGSLSNPLSSINLKSQL
jgi:hypothetical protein